MADTTRGKRRPSATRQISGGTRKPKGAQSERLHTAQQAVGNFLRATRTAQHLTQEQVSSLTKRATWKLSRAAISAIERGQNFPGMEAMLALSNVLFVDPKELVERARLSTVVPIDVTNVSYEELDQKANQYFWAGEFRKALAIYDAMLEKMTLQEQTDAHEAARCLARLEVERAATLKRAGALLSAIATAERAISISVDFPETQARAYVVLSGLQSQRGLLPLAGDAAERALELSVQVENPLVQSFAWNQKAKVRYMSGAFADAKEAFLEAHRQAGIAGDALHLTHIEGNIGMCWLAEGDLREARTWVRNAIDKSRENSQPALEASWLVELGKIDFQEGDFAKADGWAQEALGIAEPREHYLTIFRAEWLRHQVVMRERPEADDHDRLQQLRKIFLLLDQHEGIDEVQEFKKTAMRVLTAEDRKTP